VFVSLGAGTIFNRVDELLTGNKPFRPVHSFLEDKVPWFVFSALMAVAGVEMAHRPGGRHHRIR
jgi:hypothetical protein